MTEDTARRVDELLGAARTLTRDLTALLESELGVGVEHWRILRRLGLVEGASMKELGDTLCVPPATLTRLVDLLVDRGLVYRSAAEGDRRRVVVIRSDEGTDICHRADELIHVVASEASALLG